MRPAPDRFSASRARRSLRALLLLGSALAGLAASTAAAAAAQARPADPARDARVTRADANRIRGAANAPVWVVVISDFQCPFCKRWHDETEAQIERDYVRTGKVRLAYINYPIASIHPNAYATHEVAMCAAEQERFWPVAEALFRTQDQWKGSRDVRAYLDSLLRTLPVDKTRLDACVRGGEMRALIDADIDRSTRTGVGSTPSFLINGRPLVGAQPYEAFKRAIDAALAGPAAP